MEDFAEILFVLLSDIGTDSERFMGEKSSWCFLNSIICTVYNFFKH